MAMTVVKTVVNVEVPPTARPDGYVYVHDVELAVLTGAAPSQVHLVLIYRPNLKWWDTMS